MKIITTEQKPISIDALDMTLPELFIDFEMARRIGGNVLEIVCHTFKNEGKRDLGQVIITNVPSLKMVIQKKNDGVFITSNFFENESRRINEAFEISEVFAQRAIKKCYEDLGYTFE